MGTNEVPENAIRIDPAVDAAQRLIAQLNHGLLNVEKETNDDIVTMAMIILKLAGHQIIDKTKGKPKPKPEPLAGTEYNLRLKSGRIVEPGPGGFYWYYASGRTGGGVHSIDWVIARLASKEVGGVGVATRFGASDSITEFIPLDSIESIVKRVADNPNTPP